jgi:hypothetical protein
MPCPLCHGPLDEIDYVDHGFDATLWLCRHCDARFYAEDLDQRFADDEIEQDDDERFA